MKAAEKIRYMSMSTEVHVLRWLLELHLESLWFLFEIEVFRSNYISILRRFGGKWLTENF